MRFHFICFLFVITSISSFASSVISKPVDLSELFVPFWYAGVSVAHNQGRGMNEPQSQCDGLNGIIDGVNLGYQFNPYLRTEAEYQYLGCITGADYSKSNMRQAVISAMFIYPLTENIAPYLKAGAGGWLGEVSGVAGVMGIGLSYRVFRDMAFNLEYQYTNPISNDSIREFNYQRFSLGIQYRFGQARSRVSIIEAPVVKEVIINQVINVEKKSKIETVVITSANTQAALFEKNSSILINNKAFLPIVALLKSNPDVTVRIIGYTDSMGSEKYNQWLSERRAKNMEDYLFNQGISNQRIVSEGKGELDPIASNSTVKGRAMNRRVAIEFY